MGTATQRLDRLPISKWHYKLLFMIGVGVFFEGFDIYVLSSVIAAMKQTGFASSQMAATLVSFSFVGMFCGAIASGILCDKYGRRSLFVWNMLIFSIATFFCAISTSFTMVIIFRLIATFGLGGEVVVGYTLIGEFVPPENRGRWSNALFVFTNISLPVTTFVAIYVLRLEGDLGWRVMFLICSIPALLAYFIRRGIPESPRWYEAVGQKEKAAAQLDKIEAEIITQTGKELPPIKPAPQIISTALPFSALFSGKMIKRTIFAILLNVLTMLIVYGYTTWLPTYFVSSGKTLTLSMFYTTLTMCGGPIGGIIGVLISDKISRKKGIAFVSIACSIIGYFYATATNEMVGLALGFLMVTMIYFIVALAWTCYIPEQFPTALRARGNGLASGTSRLASAAMPYLVVAMMASNGGFTYVLFFISAMAALCGILTLLMGVETTGKSLEAINEAALQNE